MRRELTPDRVAPLGGGEVRQTALCDVSDAGCPETLQAMAKGPHDLGDTVRATHELVRDTDKNLNSWLAVLGNFTNEGRLAVA
jgi:ABC-type transporter Mla subunit MlaD